MILLSTQQSALKKFFIFFVLALWLVTIFMPALAYSHAPGGPSNLIANPSAEEAQDASTPIKWLSNAWGGNSAAFSYQTNGNSGSRSLKTEVTNYTDGDAKWYFEPVNVTGGKDYVFGDYYQSNVSTEVVIQYTHADNSNSYQWLGSLAPSATWADKDFQFTTPAGVTKMSVFHVVSSVGWLVVDDYSLVESQPETVPPSSSLVPNESLEQASANDPSKPVKWLTNSWGSNSSTFEYFNEGRTGSKSVKVTVSAYQSGDAKWYFEPVQINPNTSYTYIDYSKSSVSTRAVAVTYDSGGNPTYIDLSANLPANTTDWQKLERTFKTPANAVKATVFHIIETVGWLQLDDVTMSEIPSLPPPTNGNLIINPDLEVGTSSPVSWLTNSWGTNSSTHQYGSFGRNGSKGAKTMVASYTNGDAKWYFEPVSVTAGSNYSYSHYYKSNTETQAVVQYINQNDTASYIFLGILPTSNSNWQNYTQTISVPSGVVKMTVFHVVASVGELTIDDASLTAIATPPPTINPVPNPSLETGSLNQPTQWLASNWGSNTANFQYANEGRTGSKSVKVTVSAYQSGDAKWYFNPISLQPGEQYSFKVWYKTNTLPQPIAMFTLNNGSVIYSSLPAPQPSANSASVWQQYSDVFSMPSNAVSVSVFLFVGSNGWLQTDDYEIASYQAQGFNRPLVTMTFDDGWEDNITTALPLMENYSFDSTQCYATTFIQNATNQQAAINSVLAFKNAGHEICSHTVTHPFLSQLSSSQLNAELSNSKAFLESITGQPVKNFASPYGDYNASVVNTISQYYQSHRTVNAGYNTKDNFNIYGLRVQNMLSTTTIEEYQSWLDEASATNSWLILLYHRVANDPGTYDTYQSDFQSQMAALNASGITVKTYDNALSEILPQL